MKVNQHIQIVRSTRACLSSMSQKSADAILAVLARHYTRVGITTVNDVADLDVLVATRPDLVFLGMKYVPANLGGVNADKIWLANYLDEYNIAYTGSGQLAHMLELDKPLAKRRVLQAGLNTSPFYEIHQGRTLMPMHIKLTYPLFVKPTNRGGGLGIDSDSIVYNFVQLQSKVVSITSKYGADSLIEEYLPGREFSVAILKGEYSTEYSVMPVELIAPPDENGARILSAQIKSADSERSVGITDPLIKSRVSELAVSVFHALGARDYGRIDIRLDQYGTPHFLEANLIPSLIENYGNFPKACHINMGLDHQTTILHITRLGLSRAAHTRSVEVMPASYSKDVFASSLQPFTEAI